MNTISETRMLILVKVLHLLGKNYNIDVARGDNKEDGDVDEEGRALARFTVNWPGMGTVSAEEALQFTNTLSTISTFCHFLNDLNLSIVPGKDSIINTKELEEDQVDHLYYFLQCCGTDTQVYIDLTDFADGLIYWVHDIKKYVHVA